MASMGMFNNQRVSPHQSIRVTATTNLDAADPGALEKLRRQWGLISVLTFQLV